VALLSVRQGKSNIYQICDAQIADLLGSKRHESRHRQPTPPGHRGVDASDRANLADSTVADLAEAFHLPETLVIILFP
jgi:hypothetical protein